MGGICARWYLPPRTTKVVAEVGEDGASGVGGGAVARAAAVERRGLPWRIGAPADPDGRGTPAVPAGTEGGTTGGESRGRGVGGHPQFVPG